jgi:hypothetical protein
VLTPPRPVGGARRVRRLVMTSLAVCYGGLAEQAGLATGRWREQDLPGWTTLARTPTAAVRRPRQRGAGGRCTPWMLRQRGRPDRGTSGRYPATSGSRRWFCSRRLRDAKRPPDRSKYLTQAPARSVSRSCAPAPLRWHARADAFRGLPAFASLSVAGSVGESRGGPIIFQKPESSGTCKSLIFYTHPP